MPIQGGLVQRLAIDPENGSTIYAGTQGGGVFKSTASGLAWKAIRVGLEREGQAVDALAIDPTDPSRLFVAFRGNRLFRSENGGAIWEMIGEGFFSEPIREIAVASDGTVYTASSCIERSLDAGATWNQLDAGCASGSALAVDPNDPATVYAATLSPARVLVTRDGGDTWTTTALVGQNVRRLAVDPRNSDVVYAATFEAVYRSKNGGQTFPRVLTSNRERFYDVTVDAGGSGRAYVTTNRRVLRSLDGGGTWRAWGGMAPQPPRDLAQSADGQFFLATQCGIFRTDQRGQPWRPSSGNLLATEVRSLAIDEGLSGFVFAGTENCGRFRSVDGGVSWRQLPGPPSSRQTFDLAIDPAEPRRIFAATGGGLFRSLNRGTTWSGPDKGIEGPGAPGGAGFNLVRVAPTAAENVYAVRKGGLHLSTDHGTTWRRIHLDAASNTTLGVSWVTIDPTDASTVYAIKGGALLASNDGARNWRPLAGDLAGPLVVDPFEPSTLYARSPAGEGWEISRSVDSGQTWTVMSDGLEQSVESLEIDPRDPSTLYVGALPIDHTRPAFYVSRDGASSWQSLGEAGDISQARVLKATGSEIYAGTRRGLLTLPQVCGDELVQEGERLFVSGTDAPNNKLDLAVDAAGNFFATFHAPFGGAAFSTPGVIDSEFLNFERLGGTRSDRSPVVAADGPGEALVAWRRDVSSDRQVIQVRRHRINGEKRGEALVIDSGPSLGEPYNVFYDYSTVDIARSRSGDTVLVWAGRLPNGKAYLRARRLGATGRPLGVPVLVRAGVDRILAPSVAIDALGRFTVAWYESIGDQPPQIRMRAFRRNATPRRDPVTLGTPYTQLAPFRTLIYPTSAPVLAVAPTDETVIAWPKGDEQNNLHIALRWFDALGEPAGERQINTEGFCFSYCFDLAVNRFGHTLLIWLNGEDRDVLGQVFDLQGQPTSGETTLSQFHLNHGSLSVTFDLKGRAAIAMREYEEKIKLVRWRLGCSAGASAPR